jgi:hypothetical protein
MGPQTDLEAVAQRKSLSLHGIVSHTSNQYYWAISLYHIHELKSPRLEVEVFTDFGSTQQLDTYLDALYQVRENKVVKLLICG